MILLVAAAIITCTLPDGRRISTDHEVAGCMSQVELRNDGSVKRVIKTAEERAHDEQIDRDAEAMRESARSAQRRDSNLLRRYPNLSAHQAARERALRPVEAAMRSTAARMGELQVKRAKLLEQAAFYKTPPVWLQLALDANAAAQIGQRQAGQSQTQQVEQINAFYDGELVHLRTLWGQAQ